MRRNQGRSRWLLDKNALPLLASKVATLPLFMASDGVQRVRKRLNGRTGAVVPKSKKNGKTVGDTRTISQIREAVATLLPLLKVKVASNMSTWWAFENGHR
jgi:hypothetical protein